MPAFTADAPPACSFAVAIAPGSSSNPSTGAEASFQEISGIDPRLDIDDVAEDGANVFVHHLPRATSHPNLVLKRGYVTTQSELARWTEDALGSTMATATATKAIDVSLLGPDGAPLVTWTFFDALPLKWEVGPADTANSSAFTIESLELAYARVTRTVYPSGDQASAHPPGH